MLLPCFSSKIKHYYSYQNIKINCTYLSNLKRKNKYKKITNDISHFTKTPRITINLKLTATFYASRDAWRDTSRSFVTSQTRTMTPETCLLLGILWRGSDVPVTSTPFDSTCGNSIDWQLNILLRLSVGLGQNCLGTGIENAYTNASKEEERRAEENNLPTYFITIRRMCYRQLLLAKVAS